MCKQIILSNLIILITSFQTFNCNNDSVNLIIYPFSYYSYGYVKLITINSNETEDNPKPIKEIQINNNIKANKFEYIYSENLLLALGSNNISISSLNNDDRDKNFFTRNICNTTSKLIIRSFSYDWVHQNIYRLLEIPRYAIYDNYYFYPHHKIIMSPINKCWLEFDIQNEMWIERMVVNPIDRFLIWNGPYGLKRSNLDGTNVTFLMDYRNSSSGYSAVMEEIPYLMIFTDKILKKSSINNVNQFNKNISDYFSDVFEFEKNHALFDWKYGIDFDIKNDLIFWTQNAAENKNISKIIMSNMNNRSEDSVILNTKPIYKLIYSLSYDWVHRLIYFSDLESLKVCPIDKPFVEKELLKANTHLDSICVNPIDLFLVWTEGNAIYKSSMDATNITLVYKSDVESWILGLTLDIISKSLVWCEQKQIVIFNYQTKSHNKYTVKISDPRFVDYMFGDLYYGNAENYLFKQYSKVESSGTQYSYSNFIVRAKIYHTSKQPNYENQCLNYTCQYICIPIDELHNRCVCPTRVGETMDEFNQYCMEYTFEL